MNEPFVPKMTPPTAPASPANAPRSREEPVLLNFRNGPSFWGGRWQSLHAALTGAAYTLRTQPNAWIELAALVVVVAVGWWFEIRPVEWAVVGLTMSIVLALEAINTAIESLVDLVSPQYHPLAKTAKDAAAGAMIFAVLGSIWVALFIFGPKLWALIF
jgi:diacylglycerol kinase (ATP)